MKKNGVLLSSLIKFLRKLLVPTSKTQFRLYDDLHSDNWSDSVMNGQNVTIYDDKFVFKSGGENFTLRSDGLNMVTDYKFS